MKKEDIEKKLDAAVSGIIPEDMFERISQTIVSEEKNKKGIKKKLNILNKGFIAATAAACVLLVAGVVGVGYYGNNFVPDSHVEIDVNPGVDIVTNKKNRVLNVQSTNRDGEIVIDGMNLKNTELKVAVNALIGSMVQKGYIINGNTGILVTVRNNNPDKADKVKDEVLDDINFALYKNDIKARVMNQTLINAVDADRFAKENNISIGKAVFVLNLAAKDESLDAKELAKMKVSDIAVLVENKGIDIRDIVDYDYDDSIWENIADTIEDIDEDINESIISSTKTSSTLETGKAEPISAEEAKQIALAHAKLLEEDVTFVKAELDYENDRQVYEVEFYSGNVEYDYDIDAVSKEIISSDFDIEDYSIPVNVPTKQQTDTAAEDVEAKKEENTETYITSIQAGTENSAPTQADGLSISAERAKQIALSHAGAGSANFTKVELDTYKGIQVYEIEFKIGNVEYDYEINASNGDIISSSLEVDD